ncbi:hypothetical protein EJ05DRAFT_479017 [Pseudovirgaria hyperparasitica]|uniref:AB hydrolase-1 domain-containing protein n=1 Tax=Pseudovirgaria hyperparasitica TaxID=470096 RepID=A0A6A6VY88_9PEZI|nr:uncharacterized protein EJ05DRAFT_479017 [Pseudovirgaria hyperparasitica]KAF2755223.1 hypothetical protein EJ05DRAFT_479017 [Pseudovirgaria hyperparasitica]
MGLPKPTFAFTIPSLHDDTPLDCHLYIPFNSAHDDDYDDDDADHPSHPKPRPKGAVLAHPYAPLGGSYDDAVISSIGSTLLAHGWTVGTFNFRGAGASKRKTTWSGRAELEDYISYAGFLAVFLTLLGSSDSSRTSSARPDSDDDSSSSSGSPRGRSPPRIRLLLGGYSYGSLIVSHLPAPTSITTRFTSPEPGTTASEIRLRARHLAHEAAALTPRASPVKKKQKKTTHSSAPPPPPPYAQTLSISMGGEETPSSERQSHGRTRRISRESHHRVSIDSLPGKLREISGRRKRRSTTTTTTTRRQQREHGSEAMTREKEEDEDEEEGHKEGQQAPLHLHIDVAQTAFLLVSPLLAPLSVALAFGLRGSRSQPGGGGSGGGGSSNGSGNGSGNGSVLENHPALIVYGDQDFFTSAKRLDQWTARLQHDSHAVLQSRTVAGAGHFWAEQGVIMTLLSSITAWLVGLDEYTE